MHYIWKIEDSKYLESSYNIINNSIWKNIICDLSFPLRTSFHVSGWKVGSWKSGRLWVEDHLIKVTIFLKIRLPCGREGGTCLAGEDMAPTPFVDCWNLYHLFFNVNFNLNLLIFKCPKQLFHSCCPFSMGCME